MGFKWQRLCARNDNIFTESLIDMNKKCNNKYWVLVNIHELSGKTYSNGKYTLSAGRQP